MILSARNNPQRPLPRTGITEPTLWGSTLLELHDRKWASQGIQVVRPGQAGVQARGPVLHMLVDGPHLASLDVRPVLRKLHWANPHLLRIRLNAPVRDGYRERIRTSEGDRLLGIERRYDAASTASARVWFTRDAELASNWAGAIPEVRRIMLRNLRRSGASDWLAAHGHLLDPADAAQRSRWLQEALGSWSRQRAVCAEVFEYQPGVYVHESARIAPGARICAPAWIGAGVELADGDVLVGPAVLTDSPAAPLATPEPIDWLCVRSPHWTLPSLTGARAARLLFKRAFDIAFAIFALLLTLPLYPLVALAILIEDGRPIFYVHRRQTIGGRDFPCLKFRTMFKDADQRKVQLEAENLCDGPQFFIEDDPRVLRCGRLFRRFQIDELPQFLNILLGHMSVVGPRPSPDRENQYCPAWREARLSVRPGLTGLWQVRRTRQPLTDFQEWIRYDLEYVQHQSFARDLWIIATTIRQLALPPRHPHERRPS